MAEKMGWQSFKSSGKPRAENIALVREYIDELNLDELDGHGPDEYDEYEIFYRQTSAQIGSTPGVYLWHGKVSTADWAQALSLSADPAIFRARFLDMLKNSKGYVQYAGYNMSAEGMFD